MCIGIIWNNSFFSRRMRPGRGSNRSSATANVMLYCTWRPSGLTIGLHGQGYTKWQSFKVNFRLYDPLCQYQLIWLCNDRLSHFDTILACDRQADRRKAGQTAGHSNTVLCIRMLNANNETDWWLLLFTLPRSWLSMSATDRAASTGTSSREALKQKRQHIVANNV